MYFEAVPMFLFLYDSFIGLTFIILVYLPTVLKWLNGTN